MAAKKKSDGVQATIERVTGKVPCPQFLRNSLNKYLYEPTLFSGARKSHGKKLGQLSAPETDVLVANLLALDEVFRGDTDTVMQIVNKELAPEKRKKLINDAAREMQRRLDVYAYWVKRMRLLEQVLADDALDLRRSRLDERLVGAREHEVGALAAPFALRAVRELEQSEERGRLGQPTAAEYSDRADAYLALEDFKNADINAQRAIAQDGSHARAWFVRVMVALRQRNRALNKSEHHRMVAQEVAEPMSSQESMALQLADEAACTAATHHEQLEAILPEAILHWPRLDSRNYQHPEQRTIVRDLFINHLFALALFGRRHCSSEQRYRLNGLGPEWELEREKAPYAMSQGCVEGALPFTLVEIDALKTLLAERDNQRYWFFDALDRRAFAKDLKLLHLRWILKVDGYAEHWAQIIEQATGWSAWLLNENVFRAPDLSVVWMVHQHLNCDDQTVISMFQTWCTKSIAQDDEDRATVLLKQYALLFHHHFARKKYDTCAEVARLAAALFNQNSSRRSTCVIHPHAEQISMPVHQLLHWRYLEALAVVSGAAVGGEITEYDVSLLLQAESLRRAFSDTSSCFWMESEEYEGGGGEDWHVEPYGVDLREVLPWQRAIDAVIRTRPAGRMTDLLLTLAATLGETAASCQGEC